MALSGAAIAVLAVKAAMTASIVVLASLIAERSKPFIAALVLALPVSAGPAYVLLAMEHDARFIADASLSSIPVNVATAALVLAYTALARRGEGRVPCLSAGIMAWLAVAVPSRLIEWTFLSALLFVAAGYAPLLWLSWGWREGGPMPAMAKRWYDVPLRAIVVAAMVVGVVTASGAIGPSATGTFGVFPITYSSFMILMHDRMGGKVLTAAMTQSLFMLIGFISGIAALHLMASVEEVRGGLILLFLLPVLWSLLVVGVGRARARANATR